VMSLLALTLTEKDFDYLVQESVIPLMWVATFVAPFTAERCRRHLDEHNFDVFSLRASPVKRGVGHRHPRPSPLSGVLLIFVFYRVVGRNWGFVCPTLLLFFFVVRFLIIGLFVVALLFCSGVRRINTWEPLRSLPDGHTAPDCSICLRSAGQHHIRQRIFAD
jgi:hypothetical protein